MRIVWTNEAMGGVMHAYEYLGALNPQAARHVADTLLEAGDSLEHFPYRGRSVPRTDMRELVTVYPYIIRYRIQGDEVIILRVRHTSRRPTNP